jgi:hypothetical protein
MKCYGTCLFLKGLRAYISGQLAEIHLRTDANNLVATAKTTHLPEQKETIHMLSMLRKEACSGGLDDLAHLPTEHCLSDCMTKHTAKANNIIQAVATGTLQATDIHPPFRKLLQHRAYCTEWVLQHLDHGQSVFSLLDTPLLRLENEQ